MRKGFTLIELLITMVLVAVLATIAVTKYVSTLERGRAIQAIAVLRDVSDAANAKYALDSQYPSGNELTWDTIKVKYFYAPTYDRTTTYTTNDTVTATTVREGNIYRLVATSIDGELVRIACDSQEDRKYCLEAGFEWDRAANAYILK